MKYPRECGCKSNNYYGWCERHKAEHHAEMRAQRGIPALILLDTAFATDEARDDSVRQIKAALANSYGQSLLIKVVPS